ncbi:MAG: hypothetical protein M3321_04410, partial [Actinomycetota bacterium]|nr:hypothetical protein [Actinomycetota bacterium]
DRPLTVEEAVRTEADGPVRVRGTLVADENHVRLCSTLRESYPPRCGEPSLRVRGLDVVGVSNMEQAKGLGWSHAEVVLAGELADGVLTVRTSP